MTIADRSIPVITHNDLDITKNSPTVTDTVNNPFTVDMEGSVLIILQGTQRYAYRIETFVSASEVTLYAPVRESQLLTGGGYSYIIDPIGISVYKRANDLSTYNIFLNGATDLEQPQVVDIVPLSKTAQNRSLAQKEMLFLAIDGDLGNTDISSLENLTVTITYTITQ